MLLASNFFEDLAMMLIGGCCAAAWLSSFIFIRLLGIGECPVISGIIGAAIGTGTLFILPADVMWLSMVIAAAVTLAAGIIIDKAFYVHAKDLPKTSQSSAQPVNAHPAETLTEWTCADCGNVNTPDAKFCRKCGAQKQGIKTANAQTAQAFEQRQWVCADCGNVNTPDAKFCRKCGAKNTLADALPQTAPAGWSCIHCGNVNDNATNYCRCCGSARQPAAVIEKPESDTGMFIIVCITAAIGVLASLFIITQNMFRHRNGLQQSVERNYYFDLNNVELEFVTMGIVFGFVSAAGFALMAAVRKKLLGLVSPLTAAVTMIIYTLTCEQVKILNMKMALPIAALIAAVIISGLYCVFDKWWLGVINIGISIGAVLLLFSTVNKAHITYWDSLLIWFDLCGNALLMLLVSIANKQRSKSRPKQNVENTNSV